MTATDTLSDMLRIDRIVEEFVQSVHARPSFYQALMSFNQFTTKFAEITKSMYTDAVLRLINEDEDRYRSFEGLLRLVMIIKDLPFNCNADEETYDETFTCKICLMRANSSLFQCGHMCCRECSSVLRNCHMCRSPIVNRIGLRLSRTCCNCSMNEKQIAYDCGHTVCNDCASFATNCQICNHSIRSKYKIFF